MDYLHILITYSCLGRFLFVHVFSLLAPASLKSFTRFRTFPPPLATGLAWFYPVAMVVGWQWDGGVFLGFSSFFQHSMATWAPPHFLIGITICL
jgi:hypothetical protein